MERCSSLVLLPVFLAVSFASPTAARAENAASDPAVGAAQSAPTSAVALGPEARQRIVAAVIAKIRDKYVFLNKAPAIAKALRVGLSGKYRSLSEPQKFADSVTSDMESAANDRHLKLIYSAEPLPPLPPETDGPPGEMPKDIAEFLARHNYAIRDAEILDGNVGYLKLNGFIAPALAGPTLAAAMDFLKNSDALIVDLRDNGGGDPQGVAMLISYLVPPGTLINTFIERGKAIADQVWALPYVPGSRWSTDRQVYVLTSKDTASAAEEFAYDIQQLKRGRVVGEVTWGGANPGAMIPIDDHFALFVPFGSAVNPISRTNWEGVGVKPAVDRAAALSTAHRLALQKLIEGATGDRRAELKKSLEDLDAKGTLAAGDE